MRCAYIIAGALAIAACGSTASFAQLAPGMTLTCKFTGGILAGTTKNFTGVPGATPTVIGAPCSDGISSFGIAIAPNRPQNLQKLDAEQIKIIKETANSICDTVKSVAGRKTEADITGDVRAKLGSAIGKIADIGVSGTGIFREDTFEGLTQDATAEALRGDRECRQHIFDKMFDRLS